jgi:hypothetical protein
MEQERKTVIFGDMTTFVEADNLVDEIIDIDFNGEMLIQFKRNSEDQYEAINAMNGYGYNCAGEVRGQLLVIVNEDPCDNPLKKH